MASRKVCYPQIFFACKNKRSETERAKDALHSSESDGGLCGYELR